MPTIAAPLLQSSPWGNKVSRILTAALEAVEPAQATARVLQRYGDILEVNRQAYDLKKFRRVLVVGCGKAGAPMAIKTAEILGDRFTSGYVVVKHGHIPAKSASQLPENLILWEAGHPVPDQNSMIGAQHIAELLADTQADDLVIGLISGGGSSLMVSPAPGLTLADLQQLTKELLACGATIHEINTLRKHLDQVKGGGLARWASPATLVTLILSDVIGDPLDIIASGPTSPDASTYGDALQILERYGITERIPRNILTLLRQGQAGELAETPKPGDPIFSKVSHVIIANNSLAARAALQQAQVEGFHTLLLTTYLQGEARQVGQFLAAVARQVAATGEPIARPACIVAGGETTVTIAGDGLGGRNLEVALGAIRGLDGLAEMALVTLATDGGDGPTDAAGAVVTGQSLTQALRLGLQPADYLARNDSYHFFEALGGLIKTGPTLTNVNDLNFLFAF